MSPIGFRPKFAVAEHYLNTDHQILYTSTVFCRGPIYVKIKTHEAIEVTSNNNNFEVDYPLPFQCVAD